MLYSVQHWLSTLRPAPSLPWGSCLCEMLTEPFWQPGHPSLPLSSLGCLRYLCAWRRQDGLNVNKTLARWFSYSVSKPTFFFFLFSNAYTLHAMNIAALAAFADEKPAKEKKKCRWNSRGDENWHRVGNESQVGGREGKKLGEGVGMSWCRLTGTGLARVLEGQEEAKSTGKRPGEEAEEGQPGAEIHSLLLPNLPDNRARVMLHGHLVLSMSA